MSKKDACEFVIVIVLVITYAALLVTGKLSPESLLPVIMYVTKKYLDGVSEQKKEDNNA